MSDNLAVLCTWHDVDAGAVRINTPCDCGGDRHTLLYVIVEDVECNV